MIRDERSTTDGAVIGAQRADRGDADEDSLMRQLGALPVRAPSEAVEAQASRAARAAFVRACDPAPWYAKAFAEAARATVPVVLASVVGLYLSWAFATAIALNQ